MKEIPSMVSRSSNFSSKKLVSVVVLIERPLTLSDPILKLLESNYPTSRIEIFFAGKTEHLQKNEVYKQFHDWFKSVKTVTIKSAESIYTEVFPLTRGEICLFTGADCSPDLNWVKRMVETFAQGNHMVMVLGGIQQRRVNPHNKVEQYCEQIGWDSTGEISRDEKDYLASNQAVFFENGEVYGIIPLLKPVNIAISRAFLSTLSKSFTILNVLEKLRDEKLKLFFNPEAEIERFHSMDFKELDREILNDVRQKNAWLALNAKRINIKIHFLGKRQWSLPFWMTVNVSWGDFHWLNLFGFWNLVEFFNKGFSMHLGDDFWFTDEVLLLGSAFGFFSFKYFLPVLKIQPWSDFILWCWIRYRTNMSMFLSGLWAGFKFKCLYWGESW